MIIHSKCIEVACCALCETSHVFDGHTNTTACKLNMICRADDKIDESLITAIVRDIMVQAGRRLHRHTHMSAKPNRQMKSLTVG